MILIKNQILCASLPKIRENFAPLTPPLPNKLKYNYCYFLTPQPHPSPLILKHLQHTSPTPLSTSTSLPLNTANSSKSQKTQPNLNLSCLKLKKTTWKFLTTLLTIEMPSASPKIMNTIKPNSTTSKIPYYNLSDSRKPCINKCRNTRTKHKKLWEPFMMTHKHLF